MGFYHPIITPDEEMSERCPISPSEDIILSLRFLRKQFPIRLIFAMTVNNTPGQLYVALSRVVARNTTWVLSKPIIIFII